MVCHTDDDWKRRRTNRRTKIYAATDDMRKKLFHPAGDLLEAKKENIRFNRKCCFRDMCSCRHRLRKLYFIN